MITQQDTMSALVVTSVNVEGYTTTKADVLASCCNRSDNAYMQETHLGPMINWPKLQGIKVVDEIRHPKHGPTYRPITE